MLDKVETINKLKTLIGQGCSFDYACSIVGIKGFRHWPNKYRHIFDDPEFLDLYKNYHRRKKNRTY